ncbi:MAG TPA: response regulator [Syntrophales bacterium]|nr:response regulator [Syntrophales bacterium]
MSRILIIDDDEAVLSVLKDMLLREGYDVAEARDGVEGLRSFRSRPADLVITDIYMPEKEGLELIRDLRVASAGIRIIAMSGGSPAAPGFPTLTVADKLGADYTIEKPFTQKEMLCLVRRALG